MTMAQWAPLLLVFVASAGLGPGRADAAEDEVAVEFFERNVRPLLVKHCFACHSAETNSRGGLRVDDRHGLLTGGGRGPAIHPGRPEDSLLIQAVRKTHAEVKMPPEHKLDDDEVARLAQWITDGAAWTPTPSLPDTGPPRFEYEQLRREHWSWQPLAQPAVPSVNDVGWPRDDLDRFLLSRLEAEQLRPVGDADRFALIRRVTFDLTGLPPAPADVSEFLQDTSPQAWANLVDRLLASSAYGERWGRHWLDVARYGESSGGSRNLPLPQAWRYRDYVIDSFQNDKPYDQFLREQIAGDLLPASSLREKAEQLTATGFLALGVKDVNQRFKVRFLMDNVDEQIDTVTRAVLGLTASCARCHDHKYDPIPTSDYYALAGIFLSSDLCAGLRNQMGGSGLDYYDTNLLIHLGLDDSPVPSNEQVRQLRQQINEARQAFQRLRDKPEGMDPGPDGRPKREIAKEKADRLQAELDALTDPTKTNSVVLGIRDAQVVGDTEIRIRGEAELLGPVVPRGFLSVLQFPGQPVVNPRQSGRLELAAWLTDPQNPLTPRVIVNRVWLHLFGEGLVKTVDNFGVTGDKPSHPELLDHLAGRFIRDGWSIKRLVRTIVLSRAYQLSADSTPAHLAADPENRWLWRHVPRRLEAEEIRDAMLAAAGRLDPARPDGSLARTLRVVELGDESPAARQILDQAKDSRHRSVYLPLLRGLTPAALHVFDFAEQGFVTGRRDRTTVAPQALYLLNDPFVKQQSLAVAERLLARTEIDDLDRVHRAYRLILARSATSLEAERALRYLSDYEKSQQVLLAGPQPVPAAAPVDSDAGATPPDAVAATSAAPANPPAGDVPPAVAPHVAAWASFCQALFGSAEFRYLR